MTQKTSASDGNASAKSRARKLLTTTLKLCVSAAALVFVFSKIDFGSTWQTIRSASVSWLLVAVAVYVLSQVVSSERVRGMIAAVPVPIGWWTNMKLYWVGMFYNFFLPGGVGGDGYKVYWLRQRHSVKVKTLVMALLGDRISGLAAICAYVVVYAALRSGLGQMVGLPDGGAQLWFLVLLPVGCWAYWLFFRLLQRSLVRASMRAFVVSLVVQGLQMMAAVAILCALGVEGDKGDYLFLFLLSSVASAVPITLGGVGAREMAFMIGAQYLAVHQNAAVSLSLLFYAVSLVGALPGLALVLRSDLIDGSAPHAPIVAPSQTPDLDEVIEDASRDN